MTTYTKTQKPFRGRSRFFQKRKVCHFCVNKISNIDYKDTNTLRRYISDQNKIESSRKTGVCPKHQRGLSTAIKRARILSLVPSDGSHGSGRLSSRPYNSQNRNSENIPFAVYTTNLYVSLLFTFFRCRPGIVHVVVLFYPARKFIW